MSDTITILSHSVANLTKTWRYEGAKLVQDDYSPAKHFDCKTVDIASFDELCELLTILANEPQRCIIRGGLIPGRETTNVLRRKNAKGDEQAWFREIPRSYVMLDVDLKDKEIVADYTTPEGCRQAVNTALGLLPFECRIASCFWQLSSSAGFKPGIRCHLWFWLDRALGEVDLTRWAEIANENAGKQIIDVAVFRTVQPHYTANPIFDGVADPVACRYGIIQGETLVLPRLPNRSGNWRKKLEPLNDPANDHIHTHVRDACATYFCQLGPEAPDGELRVALRTAVDKSCELRNIEDSKYDEEKLESYINDGREFSKSRAAASENLLLNTDGTPKGTVGNTYLILQSAPLFNGLVGFNRRANQVILLKDSPWGTIGPWTDSDSTELTAWLIKEHRIAVDDGVAYRAVQALSHLFEFDPVADWLNSLSWDGKARLDDWLMQWCGAEDNRYNRKVSRIWPISAVARALNTDPEGVQVDTMLVLQGDTGVRKTSLLRKLAGKFYAAVIDEKDMVQKIHGPWIVEFPELGPFNHTHHNKIKGFADQKKDRYRVPYGRIPEDKVRRNVIVITTNETQWQEDATSARRYWPVDVTFVDLEKVNTEQLFAEAVLAYRAGEQWWVEAQDPDFMEAQERQYAYDPWQDMVTVALREGKTGYDNGTLVAIGSGVKTISARELFITVFGDFRMEKRAQQRLAKCMRKIGWLQEGGGWHGKPFSKELVLDKAHASN